MLLNGKKVGIKYFEQYNYMYSTFLKLKKINTSCLSFRKCLMLRRTHVHNLRKLFVFSACLSYTYIQVT